MDEITLRVPAESGFVSLARAVVANAAAHLRLTLDEVDDLRLASDEAAAHLVQIEGATTLALRITMDDEGIEVAASVDAEATNWPPPDLESSFTWQIISGLVPEPTFAAEDGRPTIRFRTAVTSDAK